MTTTISIRRRWTYLFPAASAALGLAAAFLVGPAVGWLLTQIGDAPGPLRLAALLPLAWAIPVLAILGAILGMVMLGHWHDETGTVSIDRDALVLEGKNSRRRVSREVMGTVFTDGQDLVIRDLDGTEVLRSPIDGEIAAQLGPPLEAHGFPYAGAADPHEQEYREWMEGDDTATVVGAEINSLLLSRHRALQDKNPGTAERLRVALAERGVAVRDRSAVQQYRVTGKDR